MKIYLVGGAVRDKLLGLPVKERDWVVVGATEQDMLRQGFRPVGKDFPVFLHPASGEEYALARRERKITAGYKGFAVDAAAHVTLETDLERRDLTINAMAETAEGQLIDPFHGKQDLEKRLLHHVSPAFSEDPVRILRVGRFLARYAHLGFHVAPDTLALMQEMTQKGEVDALVAERVWKELERALGEKNPEKFFEVLHACGALAVLFPDLTDHGPGWQALVQASSLTKETPIRFAALCHALPENQLKKVAETREAKEAKKSLAALCTRYRLPRQYRELALLTARHHEEAIDTLSLTPETSIDLFYALDLFRRPQRFHHFLMACRAIALSKNRSFDQKKLLATAEAARAVDVQPFIAQGLAGRELADALRKARIEKIALIWHEPPMA